ncbi:tRNA lysidine(34) synthetase TilS [Moraxella caviae]|uniref:tRNA(Ile)-lysidine synthase n=1 Tax=Moraxella caviae TaxID=34060 RepID=A0A1T0A220_9GAMM|nr:tRNA lysidine(34) synthetase TilS [Moraxella caviae]OOR89780.1 tRNA lysidine(34) synthetase TilS [Moraxella caviae]STZ10723.1 tRNA(Ile)-lysidine synthase [Moraxella caviae]VEW11826.1 tRNA(Ile)-lysidine synthase [Moraxella caviae]
MTKRFAQFSDSQDDALVGVLEAQYREFAERALDLPIKPSAKLYLACSGGRDSLALAQACWQLFCAGKMALPVLLHVHHGWQAANDAWASLVANWAHTHAYECHVLHANLANRSETAARSARYESLAAAMNDGDVLLLAHHANDQAETVLMRLADGAGVQGLAGMAAWQMVQVANKRIWLWRPWLGVPRSAISDFAKRHALPFVNDETNTDPKHARGRIRTQILPKFLRLNPKAVQNITRSAALLEQSAAVLDELLGERLNTVRSGDLPYESRLDLAQLSHASQALRQAIVHAFLGEGEPLPPSKMRTDEVLALAQRSDSDHQARLFWQGARHAYVLCRHRNVLYRYRSDVWELFGAAQSSVRWCESNRQQQDENFHHNNTPIYQSNDQANPQTSPEKVLLLKATNGLALAWRLPCAWADLPINTADISAVKLDNQTRITLANGRKMAGKKLFQALGVPAWLRQNVWQICHQGAPVLLVTLGAAWRLAQFDEVFAKLSHHDKSAQPQDANLTTKPHAKTKMGAYLLAFASDG